MPYAVVINLDYESYPYDECRELWSLIRQRMVAAGFRNDGRLFTIELPAEEATTLARSVMDEIESMPRYRDNLYNDYVKEFYGYDHDSSVNLLLPPTTGIELNEA